MIVFKYKANVSTLSVCHRVLESMDIPGNPIEEQLDEHGTIVWKGKEFIGIHYSDTMTMELYGTKNTNSVQYYEKRYPNLEWDEVVKVKTKRW